MPASLRITTSCWSLAFEALNGATRTGVLVLCDPDEALIALK
jgi:hypothetical protein